MRGSSGAVTTCSNDACAKGSVRDHSVRECEGKWNMAQCYISIAHKALASTTIVRLTGGPDSSSPLERPIALVILPFSSNRVDDGQLPAYASPLACWPQFLRPAGELLPLPLSRPPPVRRPPSRRPLQKIQLTRGHTLWSGNPSTRTGTSCRGPRDIRFGSPIRTDKGPNSVAQFPSLLPVLPKVAGFKLPSPEVRTASN